MPNGNFKKETLNGGNNERGQAASVKQELRKSLKGEYKTYAQHSSHNPLPKSTSPHSSIKKLLWVKFFSNFEHIPELGLRGRAKPRRAPLVLYTKKVTLEAAAAASRSLTFY